jgi:hypothetical protein
MRTLQNPIRGLSVERLVHMRATTALEKQDWNSKAFRSNRLGTAATLAGTVTATLLVIAALAGLTFAILRYVSERSYQNLWEMENAGPHIAPR